MNAFTGLIKKEFRIGRIHFFVSLVLLGILMILSIFWAKRFDAFDEFPIMLVMGVGMIVFHIFLLPGYMLSSLNAEGKRLHLWLHNPHSGRRLLLAKFLNGLFATGITFLSSLIFTWIAAINTIQEYEINLSNLIINDIIKLSLIVITFVIFFSFYLSSWITFFWTIHKVLKGWLGRISWFILIVGIYVIIWASNWFATSSLYNALTGWGRIEIDLNWMKDNQAFFDQPSSQVPHLNFGQILFYAVIMIGLFILSSWLLDEKVEV